MYFNVFCYISDTFIYSYNDTKKRISVYCRDIKITEATTSKPQLVSSRKAKIRYEVTDKIVLAYIQSLSTFRMKQYFSVFLFMLQFIVLVYCLEGFVFILCAVIYLCFLSPIGVKHYFYSRE